MSEMDNLYNQVLNELKVKFDNDQDFKKELEELLYFYGNKLMNRAQNDEQRQYIEENLYNLIKSQFFQGYLIMKGILQDPETELQESNWSFNKGVIRNELPIFIETAFKDSPDNWHRTDLGQSIGMKLVQELTDVYDLVRQIRKDIALYGCYKAFIEDPRYKKTEQDNHNLLLGNPFDLTFLNPQIYIQSQFITNEQEIWDLYMWSSIKHNGGWVGTAQLSRISDSDKTFYLLQFTIKDTITENEQYDLLNKILDVLPSEIKSVLQTRMYHVKELEVLIPS